MEITIPDPLESIIDAHISSEHIKIHRLFYVDHSHSTIDDEYKIAADSQSISKVTTALREFNPNNDPLFGIFGEKTGLETCLN